MRGRMVVWTVVVAVLALVGVARAVPQDGMLDVAGLKKQATENKALRRYLKYNGQPDMAEVKRIVDQAPWDDHEVTLYYFDNHKEISFARARVLGRPEVASTRYERTMTDADIRSLKAHGMLLASAPSAPDMVAAASECKGNAAERAECAAARAENAADRIDAAAVRAERAADRTEAIVEKMASRAPAPRRHRKTAAVTPAPPA